MENSSGNVFADLGLPHPERELLKAKLTLQIYRLIKERGITQTEAGKILGRVPHPCVLCKGGTRCCRHNVLRTSVRTCGCGPKLPGRRTHSTPLVPRVRSGQALECVRPYTSIVG